MNSYPSYRAWHSQLRKSYRINVWNGTGSYTWHRQFINKIVDIPIYHLRHVAVDNISSYHELVFSTPGSYDGHRDFNSRPLFSEPCTLTWTYMRVNYLTWLSKNVIWFILPYTQANCHKPWGISQLLWPSQRCDHCKCSYSDQPPDGAYLLNTRHVFSKVPLINMDWI